MKVINEMELKFRSYSQNESFARACVAAFCSQINPTLDELTDLKTAVSEAVTNCVVHAYPIGVGDIIIRVVLYEKAVEISIIDFGVGIKDIVKAREPFYTTKPNQERSGMGFTVMESFMDRVDVRHSSNKGIIVTMYKELGQDIAQAN